MRVRTGPRAWRSPGASCHRDGGRLFRAHPRPPGPGEHPHREQYEQHQHHHHPDHPDQQRDSHADQHQDQCGGHEHVRRATRRHPVGHRFRARHARRLAGPDAANRQIISPDPGLIRPGTVLVLPGRASPTRYRVGAGDTLSGIASALGTPGGWRAIRGQPPDDRPRSGRDPHRDRARDPVRGVARIASSVVCIASGVDANKDTSIGAAFGTGNSARSGTCIGVAATNRTGISTGIGSAVEAD